MSIFDIYFYVAYRVGNNGLHSESTYCGVLFSAIPFMLPFVKLTKVLGIDAVPIYLYALELLLIPIIIIWPLYLWRIRIAKKKHESIPVLQKWWICMLIYLTFWLFLTCIGVLWIIADRN